MDQNMIQSTPCKLTKVQSDGSEFQSDNDDLLAEFSQLDINNGASIITENDLISRHSKRSIEGSPLIMSKRMDSQPTPISFKHISNIPSYNLQVQTQPQLQEHQSEQYPTSEQANLNPNLMSSSNNNSIINVLPQKPCLVAVFSAADSDSHTSASYHQENALRTTLLNGPEGCLKRQSLKHHIHHIDPNTTAVVSSNSEASLADLLRVHEYTYLQHLEKKCAQMHVQNTNSKSGNTDKNITNDLPYFYAPTGMLDSDTPLSSQSLHAAKTFCGAAIAAVDLVMNSSSSATNSDGIKGDDNKSGGDGDDNNSYHRAFVVGRPPGHHAGPSGCVVSEHHWRRPDMSSSGFCLLNTVAVAAAYARYNYSRSRSHHPNHQMCNTTTPTTYGVDKEKPSSTGLRIAIVDIDVHHGNGTEEIVRHLTPHTRYLPLPSSYAPVGQLAYKPWLNEHDADDVFFASLHLYAGGSGRSSSGSGSDNNNSNSNSNSGDSSNFYPGTGREQEVHQTMNNSTTTSNNNNDYYINTHTINSNKTNNVNNNIVNICLTPIGPASPGDSKARARLSLKQRTQLHETASKEMRYKVETRLLPRLKAFQADLLLISAGFDAHGDDLYHYLDEQDFHWLTSRLCDCAVSVSGTSRVVSVLEGGYSLKPVVISGGGASTVTPTSLTSTRQQSTRQQQQQQRGQKKPPSSLVAFSSTEINENNGNNNYTANTTKTATVEVMTGSIQNINESKVFSVSPQQQQQSTVKATAQQMGIYAQTAEDGGLVKSVLAHVAALAGVTDWQQQKSPQPTPQGMISAE